MKISKTQLKQIIKEEHSRLVNEISAGSDNIPKKITHSDPASVGGSGQSGHMMVDATPEMKVKSIRKKADEVFKKFTSGQGLDESDKEVLGRSAGLTDKQLMSDDEVLEKLYSLSK